eukprot:Gb_20196 [translate_table: standard]
MGSRDQIYGSVSSLVVRPSDSGGSGHGNDYEPGEIRRDEPPRHGSSSYYERSDRFAHSGRNCSHISEIGFLKRIKSLATLEKLDIVLQIRNLFKFEETGISEIERMVFFPLYFGVKICWYRYEFGTSLSSVKVEDFNDVGSPIILECCTNAKQGLIFKEDADLGFWKEALLVAGCLWPSTRFKGRLWLLGAFDFTNGSSRWDLGPRARNMTNGSKVGGLGEWGPGVLHGHLMELLRARPELELMVCQLIAEYHWKQLEQSFLLVSIVLDGDVGHYIPLEAAIMMIRSVEVDNNSQNSIFIEEYAILYQHGAYQVPILILDVEVYRIKSSCEAVTVHEVERAELHMYAVGVWPGLSKYGIMRDFFNADEFLKYPLCYHSWSFSMSKIKFLQGGLMLVELFRYDSVGRNWLNGMADGGCHLDCFAFYHSRGSLSAGRHLFFFLKFVLGYDMKGYKNSAPPGSGSPMRHRKIEPYRHDFERNGRDFERNGRDFERNGPPRGRGFRGGRGRARFRDRSPPPGMGRGRPPLGRGFGGPGYGPPEPFGGENIARNNPNVAPREGDWICSESTCGNLNFARRTHCNNCHKPRRDMVPFGIGGGSPPGGFRGPPISHPPPMGGPPMGRGMGRGANGYEGPPVGWGRGGPREFDQGPPPRSGERFSDFRPGRDIRDRPDYRDHDDYREREKFDRAPPPVDWGFNIGSRDREREDRFHDKRGAHDPRSDRRPPSPPPRSRWGRDARDRSRSPIRGASKDYYRDPYLDRRRDDKRGGRRDRMDDAY